MFCKKCGKEILDGTKFCDGCGAKMEQENMGNVPVQEVSGDANQNSTTPNDKKSKYSGIIAIAIIAIIAIVVITSIGGGNITISDDSILSTDYGTLSNVSAEENSGITVSGDVTAGTFGASKGFKITYNVYDESNKIIGDGTIYTAELEEDETAAFSGYTDINGDPDHVKITGLIYLY